MDLDVVYLLKTKAGPVIDVAGNSSMQLQIGDLCIVDTEKYQEYGYIIRKLYDINETDKAVNLENGFPNILRKATNNDLIIINDNEKNAEIISKIAKDKIIELKLNMKLISVLISHDSKYFVFFTNFVDKSTKFSQLISFLIRKTGAKKIEFKKIGPRDEAVILGGIGICGQSICCKKLTKKFYSINIKMVKDQKIVINPTSISGLCGKLKCCMEYEHCNYIEMLKEVPECGTRCNCPFGVGRVMDYNLLAKKAYIQLEKTNKIVKCDFSEIDYKK